MPTNVYFNPGVLSEQRLYEDMIEESLRIYGQDVYYIPRVLKNLDTITNDATASEYNQAYLIEMYIDEGGYSGEGTIMSKFGLEIRDQSRLIVSRRRWENFIGRENTTMIGGRPNEGDLIYIPLSGSFHEIKFVEHEAAFYQLANIFVYELHCESFEYSGEKFNTGYNIIDSIENTFAAAETLYIGTGNDVPFHPNEEVQQFVGYDTLNRRIFVTGTLASASFAHGGVLESIQVNEIRSSDKNSRYFQPSGIGEAAQERVIIGMRSGAQYLISSVGSQLELPNDPNAQNIEFEDFGDTILDFSETNPFGEPSADYAAGQETIIEAKTIAFDQTLLRFDQNTALWDAQ
jgi:hypothetical protein